jgi:hypothetical protein
LLTVWTSWPKIFTTRFTERLVSTESLILAMMAVG